MKKGFNFSHHNAVLEKAKSNFFAALDQEKQKEKNGMTLEQEIESKGLAERLRKWSEKTFPPSHPLNRSRESFVG